MALALNNGTEVEAERICDIMLTYCDSDREFGNKLAGNNNNIIIIIIIIINL